MYLVKTPTFIKKLFPQLIWEIPNERKEIFLTFDDGPTPGITEKIIEILHSFRIHATFFALGKNIETYPDYLPLYQQYGHILGNHGYHHLNGWKTDLKTYLHDTYRTHHLIHSSFFRPPYGKITLSQRSSLEKSFKIIMWDVLSGDFDPLISPADCMKNITHYTQTGSIIVCHDSQKAAPRLLPILRPSLEILLEKGFVFSVIR